MNTDELLLAIAILSVPILIIAGFEFSAMMRRRRERAISQRSKAPRRR